jgi:hypothetical protein
MITRVWSLSPVFDKLFCCSVLVWCVEAFCDTSIRTGSVERRDSRTSAKAEPSESEVLMLWKGPRRSSESVHWRILLKRRLSLRLANKVMCTDALLAMCRGVSPNRNSPLFGVAAVSTNMRRSSPHRRLFGPVELVVSRLQPRRQVRSTVSLQRVQSLYIARRRSRGEEAVFFWHFRLVLPLCSTRCKHRGRSAELHDCERIIIVQVGDEMLYDGGQQSDLRVWPFVGSRTTRREHACDHQTSKSCFASRRN